MTKEQYIQNLKEQLYSTDYIAIKDYEGQDTSKYGDWKKARQDIREEIELVRNMTEEEFQEYYKDKEEI